MSSAPVVPWPWLLTLAAALVVIRVITLYRILDRTPPARRRRTLLRWAGLTAAVLLVLVAAARPGIDTGRDVSVTLDSPASPGSDLNVFFVVDRSVDAPVSAVRADIAGLIDEYPDARFALISFATRATLDWPLSDDVWSLQSLVSGLSPYLAVTPDQPVQTNAFAARDVLRAKTDAATEQYPGSRNVVFYLGTGAPDSAVSRGSFEVSSGNLAGGAVFGYDGAAGADGPRLEEIADQLGVPFVRREPGRPIAADVPSLRAGIGGSGASLEMADRHELYWLFTMLAAALVLAEVAFTLREYRKNRLSRRDVRI